MLKNCPLCTVRFSLVICAIAFANALTVTARCDELPARLRRPVAVQLSEDEQLLFAANRVSGSVSIVDLRSSLTVRELAVGKQLSDLIATPDQKWLLATDEGAHELLLIENDVSKPLAERWSVKQRLAVSPFPVSISVSKDGRQCCVASLWSRRITMIALPATPEEQARITRVVDLSIAPRHQQMVKDDSRLIVADSFGGRLAILDTQTGEVLGIREFPGHNVRGLGISVDGKMLVVAHQMLNDYAHTIRNDVHWGLLMSNDLRWLRLENVLSGKGRDLYEGGHMHPLGHAGNATGDPAGLAVASDGTVVVTLGGVGEVALGKENDFSLQRTGVGKRPTAVAISRDASRAFVANTFGDSISIVNLKDREQLAEISLGPQSELTLVDRGEALFYDAGLSHDRWMSCHSCHTDGHSNGQLNDNFSDESFGASKRVLTLLGRADTAPFAWNASAPDMDTQIRKSLVHTMQADGVPGDRQVKALVAYVESLASPPSVDKLRGTLDEAAVHRGRQLFEKQNCNRCHTAPTFTSPDTYDVGLKDKQGNTQFNPPSLRGVSQRAPYFHDNRAATLEEVFRSHDHPEKWPLGDAELKDLIAFLRSL